MPRVCVIAPVHHNRDIRIFYKEIMSLLELNYTVTQVSRVKKSIYQSNNFKQVEVPEYKSRLHRLLLIGWLVKVALKEKADIYHLHNPDTVPLGIILKLFRKKVIYDTHEDFSKRLMMREWIPKLLRKPLTKFTVFMEYIGSNFFDHTFVTQPDIINRLSKETSLIYNYPISKGEIITKAYHLSKSINKNYFTLIYAGGISKARGIDTIVKAMEVINQQYKCRLWLMGACSESFFLEQLKKEKGWKYVDYIGEVPQESAYAHMIAADIGLILIKDIGDHSTTSPNKLFEYQLFGIPFIASNFPNWEVLFSEEKTGLFVSPDNVGEIVKAISYYMNHPKDMKLHGSKGRELIRKRYTWEEEVKKMIMIYKEILAN